MPCATANDGTLAVRDYAGHFAERRAAWKYLLPMAAGAELLAIGFDDCAGAAFARSWQRVLTETEDHAADGTANHGGEKGLRSAVALNLESPHRLPRPAEVFELLMPGGAAAWVGRGRTVPTDATLQAAGFASIRRYAVLPPGKGKILVPLRDPRFTQAALDLYIPGTERNRALVSFMRLLTRAGLQRLFGRRQVVVGQRPGRLAEDAYLLDWLGGRLERPVVEAAIYPGTNDTPGRRKVTMQLLDADARVLGIAKVADTEPAAEALQREADVLDRLGRDSGIEACVPRIVARGDWHGHAIQVQTPLEHVTGGFRPVWTSGHQEFMERLSRIDRLEMPLRLWPGLPDLLGWARSLPGDQSGSMERVREAVESAASLLADLRLPFHLAHGDFTPWNVFVGDDHIVVFDWEESRPHDLPLSDLFHFHIMKQSCLSRPFTLEELFSATPRSLGIEAQLTRFQDSLDAGTPGSTTAFDFPTAFFRLLAAAECCRRNSPINRLPARP